MPDLYLSRIQPNPRGRDLTFSGRASNAVLNEEWVEFRATATRSLNQDVLLHQTYNQFCQLLRAETLCTFGAVTLPQGNSVRVHTGSGQDFWDSDGILHVYLGRSWFVWNNECGDRATLSYNNTVVDSASYDGRPPEGVLQRVAGTDRFQGYAGSLYGRL